MSKLANTPNDFTDFDVIRIFCEHITVKEQQEVIYFFWFAMPAWIGTEFLLEVAKAVGFNVFKFGQFKGVIAFLELLIGSIQSNIITHYLNTPIKLKALVCLQTLVADWGDEGIPI